MSNKKKRYYGYDKPIPKNIVVQKINKKYETRYIILDADTGEIFDDAQGYGYTSKQKAYAAYNYKKRDKKTIDAEYDKKEYIQRWCKRNKELINDIEIIEFYAFKDREDLTEKDYEKIFKNHNIDIDSLSFTIKEFLKWRF